LTGGVIASLGKLQAVISAASARYRYFYFSHWWCRGRYWSMEDRKKSIVILVL